MLFSVRSEASVGMLTSCIHWRYRTNPRGREMAYVQVGANAFHVRRSGTGDSIVLLHGVGADIETWDGVVAALGDGFDVLSLDQRGHGRSHKPSGPFVLEDFVEDLHGVLNALEFSTISLAGFSLGGLVAQAFALKYPERLNKLALISTVAGRTDEERARVLARAETLSQQGAGAHLSEAVTRWFTDGFIASRPDVLEWRRQKSLQNDPAAYAAAYRVLAESDLANEIHRITAPTLVMTGECDAGSTPRMAELLAARISRAECVILPELKHSVLLEAPDLIASELHRFLAASPD